MEAEKVGVRFCLASDMYQTWRKPICSWIYGFCGIYGLRKKRVIVVMREKGGRGEERRGKAGGFIQTAFVCFR